MDSMSEAPKLPFSLFTTEEFSPRAQFDAWQHSISVIFDVAPLGPPKKASGFKASVRAYQLGDLYLGKVDFDGQRFLRKKHRAATDGLDHYLVQLYATGGLVGTAEDREVVLRAGDVQILDLGRSNATETKASSTIAIMVPRQMLREALPTAGDLHGLVLRGSEGMGALLADYMRLLLARADAITPSDAPLIAQATTKMIAACFQGAAETWARAQTPLEEVMLVRIQHHIAASLDSPELYPEALCRAFRISRTQLYRLFEPLGGVAAYIQEQRLMRAYRELSDPTRGRRIKEIAFGWGFSSEAHFSRAFRRAFDMSPSEARARAQAVASPGRTASGGYEEWIRRLRRE
jgi:AraC-like DNA-binding protein